MGFVGKVVSAVSLWANADHRRRDVLSECIFYGIGMAMIGVVYTVLAATGTFPTSLEVLQATGMLGICITNYVAFAAAGGCAYLATKSARDCLRRGEQATTAQVLLVFGAVFLLVSTGLTVASIAKSAESTAQHKTPAWVYVLQALILVLRLLFLSVLVMAIYTLVEAARDPGIARMVTGMEDRLPVCGVPAYPVSPTSVPMHTATAKAPKQENAAASADHPGHAGAAVSPLWLPDQVNCKTAGKAQLDASSSCHPYFPTFHAVYPPQGSCQVLSAGCSSAVVDGIPAGPALQGPPVFVVAQQPPPTAATAVAPGGVWTRSEVLSALKADLDVKSTRHATRREWHRMGRW